jgi:hypothetical protein
MREIVTLVVVNLHVPKKKIAHTRRSKQWRVKRERYATANSQRENNNKNPKNNQHHHHRRRRGLALSVETRSLFASHHLRTLAGVGWDVVAAL